VRRIVAVAARQMVAVVEAHHIDQVVALRTDLMVVLRTAAAVELRTVPAVGAHRTDPAAVRHTDLLEELHTALEEEGLRTGLEAELHIAAGARHTVPVEAADPNPAEEEVRRTDSALEAVDYNLVVGVVRNLVLEVLKSVSVCSNICWQVRFDAQLVAEADTYDLGMEVARSHLAGRSCVTWFVISFRSSEGEGRRVFVGVGCSHQSALLC
jgi:hypothetical protein